MFATHPVLAYSPSTQLAARESTNWLAAPPLAKFHLRATRLTQDETGAHRVGSTSINLQSEMPVALPTH
ncbi:Uncharacterised protein [Vibrio cholerae]|nr:Uncharacterised protein [Vibrio cholerae]